jgi:hypothetical protein
MLSYLREFRDASLRFYEDGGLMRGGYWREQEAHHGPEYYQIFLSTLATLDPGDSRTIEVFRGAADLVVGRATNAPLWFDAETGMFRSLFLGSEHVGDPTINAPDHLRFADLCLKCHRLSADEEYRDVALSYLRRWASPVATAAAIPAALSQEGEPLSHRELANDDYLSFVGQLLPAEPDLSAAENLIASGAVGLFLAAWCETEDQVFIRASERLIDTMIPSLAESAAWQVPAQIRRYRDAISSERYDDTVLSAVASGVRGVERLEILDRPPRPANRFVGDRTDKPDWIDEDGREPSNAVLIGLAAQITSDDTLWTEALDQAAAYLSLALDAYGPYRDHGCTAKAFHAIARGHGRQDGAGVVTEILNRYLGLANPEVVGSRPV